MRTCLILLAVCVTACTGGRMAAPERMPTPVVNSARIITGDEIARRYRHATLLETLQVLRPRFLALRGANGTLPPDVYLDGAPLLGGIADLATIRSDAVREVQYLGMSEAATRFGGGHMAGAILVTMAHAGRR